MSTKGQIVIPKEIREKLKIHKGANFTVIGRDNILILKRIDTLDELMLEKTASALLSEKSFAKDWDTPEEDEAWKNL